MSSVVSLIEILCIVAHCCYVMVMLDSVYVWMSEVYLLCITLIELASFPYSSDWFLYCQMFLFLFILEIRHSGRV